MGQGKARLQISVSSLALGILGFATSASAQSAVSQPPSDPATQAQADASGKPVDVSAVQPTAPDAAAGEAKDIIVTGSRLSGFSQPTPVSVLGAGDIQRIAPANVQEVLNLLPSARPTFTTGGNSRGAVTQNGVQGLVDLRGLGATRTLTLVDGQRFVPGGISGAVDSNLLPTSLIKRVDVVTGGASAAYGSDAVAGVVNFVLDDRLVGVEASLQYGETEYHDGKQVVASLAAGTSFAGGAGHIVAAFDYAENKGGTTVYSRPWGRVEPNLVGTGAVGSATRPAGTPAQVWSNGVERNDATPYGLIVSGPLAGTAFTAAGTPYAFSFGTRYGTSMTGSNANYGFNPSGFGRIGIPFDRESGYVKASLDVGADTTLFVTGNLARTFDSYSGGPPLKVGPYTITLDNAYLPAATRQAMIAAGVSSIQVSRFLSDVGNGANAQGSQKNQLWRYSVGGSGSLSSRWKWDAYFTQGETVDHLYSYPSVLAGNLAASIYAVRDSGGNIVCGSAATNPNLTAATRAQVQSGCVPFNIFGQTPANSTAYDYFVDRTPLREAYKQTVAALNLRGQPFSIGGRAASLAIGGEARWESIRQTVDPLFTVVPAVYLNSAQAAYAGSNDVQEGYVELGVPLLEGLNVDMAGRVTHYRVGGTVETWKAGLTYDISDAIRVRATRSRDIRAPNLFDLYGLQAPATVAGVNSPFTNTNGNTVSAQAGNRFLKPEVAQTFTGGIVLRPEGFLTGLRASVDYFAIKIDKVIATVGVTDIIQGCFSGNQEYCAAITFDSSNPLGFREVDTVGVNLAKLKTSGVDVELDYTVPPLPFPGKINFRFLGTYTHRLTVTTPTGTVDYSGTAIAAPAGGGVPKFRGSLTTQYAIDRFALSLQLNGFSNIHYNPTLVGPDDPAYDPNASNSISINKFPARIYANLNLSYKFGSNKNIELFGFITNLFAKAPPAYALVAFGSGQANYYDVVGRTYQGGVRVAF